MNDSKRISAHYHILVHTQDNRKLRQTYFVAQGLNSNKITKHQLKLLSSKCGLVA